MPVKVSKAIELTVLVAEEDYKYNLNDWDTLTEAQQAECQRDAYTPSKDDEYATLIHMQKWIIRQSDNESMCLQASLNGLLGRTWRVIG